jgi:hypothetical protein
MSFIDITTNNLSRDLSNSTTVVDNWVYVPGTAITGDYTKPLLFTSLDDFKSTCGDHGPEGSSTFEYVSGLLSAGMPVMFRRIACENQDTSNVLKALQASAEFKHTDDDGATEIVDFKVTEKYGGSFGNNLYISYRPTASAIWLDVILDKSLIERKRLAIRNNADTTSLAKEVIKSLHNVEFERIIISNINDDETTFDVNTERDRVKLSGGTDMDESLVAKEIPQSYKFIYDKMLFKPKFITSGGYTDSLTDGTFPIASAMKAITQARQDCVAIIDLPIGTEKAEYDSAAASLAYTQYTDTSTIPSARLFGPWVYVRVGSDSYWMPPSFAYLTTMGNRLAEGKKPYNPVAGLSTGVVKNVVKTEFEIGSDIAEEWQSDDSVNINPIMKINGSTYAIGGNSTLLIPEEETGENNLFLESSADLAVIDIRRFVYNLATELQYQYNSAEVFETFGLRTSDYLDRMISEGAVTDYAIYNESSDKEPRKLKIRLDVYLSPTVKKIEILLNVGYGSVELDEGGNS